MGISRYGSKDRPVKVSVYHVVDDDGRHRFLSVNDYFMNELGGQDELEARLRGQFRSVELLGTCDAFCLNDDVGTWSVDEAAGTQIEQKIGTISDANPNSIIHLEPWISGEEDRKRLATIRQAESLVDSILGLDRIRDARAVEFVVGKQNTFAALRLADNGTARHRLVNLLLSGCELLGANVVDEHGKYDCVVFGTWRDCDITDFQEYQKHIRLEVLSFKQAFLCRCAEKGKV